MPETMLDDWVKRTTQLEQATAAPVSDYRMWLCERARDVIVDVVHGTWDLMDPIDAVEADERLEDLDEATKQEIAELISGCQIEINCNFNWKG
jgi:hypothetical protein